MNNENPIHEQTLKQRILSQIAANGVPQHSRSYYLAKLVVLAVVAIAILLTSVGIINFILFSLRLSGQSALLGFGSRGYMTFFALFPWYLIILDILFIALLEWLLRQFRFGYQRSVLFLLIGIIALSLSLGLILDRATDVNDRILNHADTIGLPAPFQGIVESARQGSPKESGICKCRIESISGSTITAVDTNTRENEHFTIELAPNAPELSTLKVGDLVFIAGDADDKTIKPFGIHKL
jgi:hypothetical protein